MIKKGQSGRIEDFIASFTAGENIAQGDAVALAVAALDIFAPVSVNISELSWNATKNPTGTTWYAQKFTCPADVTKLYYFSFKYGTGGTNSADIRIRSSLTGSDLWTGGWSGDPYGNGDREWGAQPNLALTPGQDYYIIISASGVDLHIDNTDTYGSVHVSTNSGSSWSAEAGYRWGFQVQFIERTTVANRIYKARATAVDALLNFIGFAQAAITSGQIGKVDGMQIGNLSGLTPGSDYYLSDTAGALSTSQGTIKRYVGKALSSSRILRPKNAAPVGIGSISGGVVCPVNAIIYIDATNSTISVDSVSAAYSNDSCGMIVRAGETCSHGGYVRLLDI